MRVVLGALLTVVCALGAVLVFDGSSARRELLVAARAISAGHVIEAADLRPVSLEGAEGLSVIPVEAAAGVIGRAATVPVAAGALLPADLASGAGVLPPAGKVIVSVALDAGDVPPQAGPGAAVRVVPTPAAAAAVPTGRAGTVSSGWRAVLLGVAPAGSNGAVVASLQVEEADAVGLVSAGTGVSIVVLAGGR